MSRILVIDSADTFYRYVELVVSRYGCATVRAASASEGLESLARQRPNLVMAQESLPDMSWPEFCRRIEAQPDMAGIPVVVLASDPGSFDRQGCGRIEVEGVRTRPVSMRDLIGAVQRHLPYRNRRHQIRVPLSMPAMIREEGGLVPCQVLNVSEGGLFVMRRDPFPLGSEIHLMLSFVDDQPPVEVAGEVVYSEMEGKGRHPRGMGVKFHELEPGTLERLRQYIREHLAVFLAG